MTQPQPHPSLEVGVAVLAVQLTEVIKDVTDLQKEMVLHRADHQQEKRDHAEELKQQRQERTSARRWLIGVALTIIGSIGGLYALAVQLLSTHH